WTVVGDRDHADGGATAAIWVLVHDFLFRSRLALRLACSWALDRAAADRQDDPLPTLQHTQRRHEADASRRRLHLRLEIPLRLQQLLAAVLAAAVFRAHVRIRAAAGRCRRISTAAGPFDRLR